MKPEPGTYFTCANAVVGSLRKVSGVSAKVYLILCQMADRTSGTCFPSHATIASFAEASERSVRRALKEPADHHLIQIKNRGCTSNLYSIVYPATDGQLEGKLSGHDCPDNDLTGQNQSINRPNKSLEPTLLTNKDTSCPSEEKTKPRNRRRPSDFSEQFANWYAVYPRKEKPEDAFKAFERTIEKIAKQKTAIKHPGITTLDEAQQFLIRRANAYAAELKAKGTEDRFIQLPASWLNGGGFDTEYGIDKKASRSPVASHHPRQPTIRPPR